ncbi:hypothetical protein [Serratia rubidaea]|uniref:Uncharacterized protein n=1 Tax=Serratia rubidaea TaxID=61652 RepID=A0A3S4X8P9_SERRU|nr:hypothetical protein [Serratia rubidaea]MBH1928345.1 hypothetical protein [Serratia rubidaea]MDC6119977.1 hypothetical protein [Serratia rubidaea]VEI61095.1 Uncharacterised protein [Serratia rubidaea]
MLQVKVFEKNEIYRSNVAKLLIDLHEKIFSPPGNITSDDIISAYIPPGATISKTAIYYDNKIPVGFICMQKYEIEINKKKVNVFRSQVGLLKSYRNKNIVKLTYLKFVISEMLRTPRKSLFFELCIHPSSYCAILKKGCNRNKAWPTKENAQQNMPMKDLCETLLNTFDLEIKRENGVFIHNDGLGPTRIEKKPRGNISSDAKFFIETNPDYVNGDGLAIVVSLSVKDILVNICHQMLSKINRSLMMKPARGREESPQEKPNEV